ncbi:hypothetical protein FZEAL_6219 [Fusarium zealandicum]|uniref:Peptidase S1 domain-containing protein n=1 Tax=Fusarium zealandicum TaxID=1053134 RepID=A0A8H4UJB0_9HYPO|nr:hypothetical protein FZEAL_6219 [Fusarium zealandicum]
MASPTPGIAIGRWSLGNITTPPVESTLVVGPQADAIESALADDSRTKVSLKDIQPGGKYYSIVKLQIRFEKQLQTDKRWAQGTGWLIEPNLLVTAGHCVFDHTYSFGKAVKVRAFIGYNGKDSIETPGVQCRYGVEIVTPKEWIESDINRANDVSFIRVDTAFTDVQPIKYEATATFVNMKLGVVGYPADKTYKDESAAQMYEMYKKVTCDLSKTTLNMLEYKISSSGGQSGSPVLIDQKNTAIGVHVYGLGTKNSASVIRGKYGNYFKDLTSAMGGPGPVTTAGNGIGYIQVQGKPESELEEVPLAEEESFWDTVSQVVNVGSNIGGAVLQAGTPFLGPIGAPIAAVVGTALCVVSKLTDQGSEASFETGNPQAYYKQHATRAILGEAALQTVLKMNMEQLGRYKVYAKMKDHYGKTRNLVPRVARIIAPAITEPALRIAVETQAPTTRACASYPKLPETESSFDSVQKPFVEGLLEQCKPSSSQPTPEQEDFFGFLTNIVHTAVSVATPVIGAISAIADVVGAAEDSFVSDPTYMSSHMEVLCHRALLGEAALQALMDVPTNEIQQEGFFGDLVSTVKTIASTVIKVAPTVIKTVTPIVNAINDAVGSRESQLTKSVGGDSNLSSQNSTAETGSVPAPSASNSVSKPAAGQSVAEPALQEDQKVGFHPQEDGLSWGPSYPLL